MKQLISIRVSDATRAKLDTLITQHGTQTEVIALAIDRMYREGHVMGTREERIQELLKSRPDFMYVVTEYTRPMPLYYPARRKEDAARIAVQITKEIQNEENMLPHNIDISTRHGYILAELSRNGKVDYDPDAHPESTYFAKVLDNAMSLES